MGSNARAFIAIGQHAQGVICLGQFGIGFVCISQLGIGLIFGIQQIGAGFGFGVYQIGAATYVPFCQFGIGFWRVKLTMLGLNILSAIFGEQYFFVLMCKQKEDDKEN